MDSDFFALSNRHVYTQLFAQMLMQTEFSFITCVSKADAEVSTQFFHAVIFLAEMSLHQKTMKHTTIIQTLTSLCSHQINIHLLVHACCFFNAEIYMCHNVCGFCFQYRACERVEDLTAKIRFHIIDVSISNIQHVNILQLQNVALCFFVFKLIHNLDFFLLMHFYTTHIKLHHVYMCGYMADLLVSDKKTPQTLVIFL